MTAIRAVRTSEATLLRDVRLRVLAESPEAFSTTVEEESARPEGHWTALAVQSERADAAVVFVAVEGTRWVGIAAGRWFDRERGIAHLWSMWVDPAARGAGLGERLVLAVRGWAAQRGARFLRLGVVPGPGDAGGFYERLGFVRTGETKVLTRDPSLVAFFMVRPV